MGKLDNALDIRVLATTTPPPEEYIIDPLVRRGRTTMLAGQPKRGKSLVSLALSLGVTHGEEVAGFKCESGHVLYIDGENAKDDIHSRVYGFQPDRHDNLTYIDVRGNGFDLRVDIPVLDQKMTECECDLVVLDSLRSLYGGSDRNVIGIVSVLNPLGLLADKHSAGILVLHHTVKSGNTYSGSNALVSAVTHGAAQLMRVKDDRDPQRRVLLYDDLRSRSAPDAQWVRIMGSGNTLAIEEAESGDAIPTGTKVDKRRNVLYGLLAGKGQTDAAVEYEKAQNNGWCSQKTLCAAVGSTTDQTSRRALKALENDGKIEQRPGTRRGVEWRTV